MCLPLGATALRWFLLAACPHSPLAVVVVVVLVVVVGYGGVSLRRTVEVYGRFVTCESGRIR